MPIKETGFRLAWSIARDAMWIVIPLLIAAAIFGYKYHFPKRIAADYPAVEYRTGEPSSAEHTAIHVKGKLYRPLFRDRYFKGRIAIDKYDFTASADYTMFTVKFNSDVLNGWGSFGYSAYLNRTIKMEMLGAIWQHDDMKELKFTISEPIGASEKQWKGLTLIAPADTIEEAVAIEQAFSEREQTYLQPPP
ncbi:hypothetical protein SAMN05216312_102138 [Cohnella sp. OV330]|uniref:hypothetical protein n=1 Tax=Cohnella sp. OV330 TaxID=1855288 RepID=UPI0008EA4AE3|nr:hypothetical protein [Cohnella sp. OV330]SFA90263.1 hypothetical protein SAMN05216312_102138 [Cohnella sp. OV330]